MAGLLIMGREEILRKDVTAHEIAFQVLEGTDVRVNEFFRKPLLRSFEEVELLFKARIDEQEIQVGLVRVPIPNYDRRAFREAFINALVHRDYSRLGSAYVRLDDDGPTLSSPGGFVEGITLHNLLVAAPRSRNPLLAERTGRGIDRIYEGMLRYDRPAPDYEMSDVSSVVFILPKSDADTGFLEMILRHEEQTGTAMPIDSLIILSRLRLSILGQFINLQGHAVPGGDDLHPGLFAQTFGHLPRLGLEHAHAEMGQDNCFSPRSSLKGL